jgi:4-amino-4-deoxy-L-arabinose transferase-like glycosyltransferase
MRRPGRILALIVIVGAALRIYLVATAAGVNNDAFKYAQIAGAMADHGLVAGLEGDYFWPYFPVNRQLIAYPLAGAMVNCVVGDMILSLRLVSMLCGIGLIGAVFAVARELIDREDVALLSAGLVAFHPEFARASAAVYREVPMAFLLTVAVLFFLWSLREEDRYWAGWATAAGAVFFLSFMTRPDGLAAATALGLVCLLGFRGLSWQRRALICLLMGAVFIALEIPYVSWIKHKTGYWMINQWQIQNKLRPPESARQHLLPPEENSPDVGR